MAKSIAPQKERGSEVLDRMPPVNLDAEMGVIGSVMLQPDSIDDVSLIVDSSDFYDDSHRKLFRVMVEMYNEGKKLDIMLLAERLRQQKILDEIGGSAFLAKVFQSVPNAAHAVYYAGIVREKSTSRSLITASTEILRDAYDESCDSTDMMANAERKIASIADRTIKKEILTSPQLFNKALDEIEARLLGKREGGLQTGYVDLDDKLNPMSGGQLIIVAGRPGMGKSSFAMNIVESLIYRDVPCLVFSLEMSSEELTTRMFSSLTNIPLHKFMKNSLTREERERLIEEAAVTSKLPLFVLDDPKITIFQMASYIRRMSRKVKPKLVVIDYLQLIEPANNNLPREQQVAGMSKQLKQLAREIDIPIMVLAQMNRQVESASDHRPRLSHLRESGAIEQDADVVLFVHREEIFQPENKEFYGLAEIVIAKQRSGVVGVDVDMVFRKDVVRFENKARPKMEDEAPDAPRESQPDIPGFF